MNHNLDERIGYPMLQRIDGHNVSFVTGPGVSVSVEDTITCGFYTWHVNEITETRAPKGHHPDGCTYNTVIVSVIKNENPNSVKPKPAEKQPSKLSTWKP